MSQEETKKKKKRVLVVAHRMPIATPCDQVVIGQVILCKMRGYCEWPAKVTGFDSTLICIEFYGDHTTHKSTLCNCFKFEQSHEIIIANLKSKKTPLYKKSVLEAERELNIPPELSIINKI